SHIQQLLTGFRQRRTGRHQRSKLGVVTHAIVQCEILRQLPGILHKPAQSCVLVTTGGAFKSYKLLYEKLGETEAIGLSSTEWRSPARSPCGRDGWRHSRCNQRIVDG